MRRENNSGLQDGEKIPTRTEKTLKTNIMALNRKGDRWMTIRPGYIVGSQGASQLGGTF